MSTQNTKQTEYTEQAIFAGGCFWGIEYFFQKAKGVLETSVGYIGGNQDNPKYLDVCNHTTGHAEAIEIFFDTRKTDFETLARLFFEIHDPTQINRQGPDVGEQYRSEIFYINDEQKQISEKLIKILNQKGYKVATRLSKAEQFWQAEEYHQDYYKNKSGIPCHLKTKRF